MKVEEFNLDKNQKILRYWLKNKNDLKVSLLNVGAVIQSILMTDKNGKVKDIVLGYDDPKDYLTSTTYFGAVVGRYGNRIKNGRFHLNDREYVLGTNNGSNHLHGGNDGYDKRIWDSEIVEDTLGNSSVAFSLKSPSGDQGYPGNLIVKVTYTLEDDNKLSVRYEATADEDTPVNLTQHSYFNLSGDPLSSVHDHDFQFDCDHYTPVDESLIPTGEVSSVNNTPFDFKTPKCLHDVINQDHSQLVIGAGFDHNLIFKRESKFRNIKAQVSHHESGRRMDLYTDQPAVQFYSGNFLDGSVKGKGDVNYPYRSGFCLETQHYPDSPNNPHFPSTIVTPETPLDSLTVFSFQTD